MNHEQVFQLARDKGYRIDPANVFFIGECSIAKDDDSIKHLLKLTLIQQWLRDEHGIYIEITRMNVDIKYFRGLVKTDENTQWYESFDRYEQALTEGIYQALQLIK